jgi:hypothetical protein
MGHIFLHHQFDSTRSLPAVSLLAKIFFNASRQTATSSNKLPGHSLITGRFFGSRCKHAFTTLVRHGSFLMDRKQRRVHTTVLADVDISLRWYQML